MKVTWNTPTVITFSRLALTGVLLFVLLSPPLFNDQIVRVAVIVILYVLAAISDYYDGHLARKLKERTEFGSFTDSLIDKIFTISVFYAMVAVSGIIIFPWFIHIILFREITITILRIVKTYKRTPMVTEYHGKVKTTIQIIAQSILLAYLLTFSIVYETQLFQSYYLREQAQLVFIWDIDWQMFANFFKTELGVHEGVLVFFKWLPNMLIGFVTFFTLYSGISYFMKNRVAKDVD